MDRIYRFIASKLPRGILYFCGIRILAIGTVGKWSSQIVPELTMVDALDRLEV